MSFGGGFGPVGPGQDGDPGSPGATGATGAAGLGGQATPDRFASAGSPNRAAGDFTCAMTFWVTNACNCTGISFYWVASGTETITAKLRDSAGTVLATATAVVSTTGIHVATFASPYALTAATRYKAGVYNSSASFYTRFSAPSTISAMATGAPYYAGNNIVVETYAYYAAGDANPTSSSGSEKYAQGPVVAAI